MGSRGGWEMRRAAGLALAGGLCASWLLAGNAHADGVLRSSFEMVHPTSTKVDVQVFEQVATTTTELTFPVLEGSNRAFVFPVPEGATVTGFWTLRNGSWESATLDSEAPTTVDDVTENSSVASTLDACGGDNAFVIELPDSIQDVRLEYAHVLPYGFGEVSFEYPMAPCAGAELPGYDSLELRLDVTSARPLAGFSAPGFGSMAHVESQTDNSVRVTYRATDFIPSDDFLFNYGVEQESDLYVNLLTDHPRCAEDGYFLLIVEPVHDIDESQALPKSFSFVMDVSGSMAGFKIERARAAAKYFVFGLNDQDAFNVVTFNEFVDPLFPAPQAATAANRQLANQFLDAQYAAGITDIHRALLTALQGGMDENTARIVALLTDGKPTSGVVDPGPIVNEVTAANTSNARLFTFGIGLDVNMPLLTALAESNHGEAKFLAANEDIATALGMFYEKIDLPVLTDVTLSFGGIEVYDVFPSGLTDLYAGSQLFVVGRYRGFGLTTGSLSGRRLDETVQYEYPLTFPECALDEHAFLPCLWAKAKVDALITEMMLAGVEDPAKVSTVEQLANRCGLQTPYTSYGVENDPAPSGSWDGSSSSSGSIGSPSHYGSGGLETDGCSVGGVGASMGGWQLLLLGAAAWMRRRRCAK